MISLSTYGGSDKMRSDLSGHCQRHVFAHPQNSPERHRRASLSTPARRHGCEVILHGAASSITCPIKLDPIKPSCRRTALPQSQLGTDTVLQTGRRWANQRLASIFKKQGVESRVHTRVVQGDRMGQAPRVKWPGVEGAFASLGVEKIALEQCRNITGPPCSLDTHDTTSLMVSSSKMQRAESNRL